jgi:hypothetical protein
MRNRPRLIAPMLGIGLSALLAGCGWSSGETTLEEAKEEKAPHRAMAMGHEMKSLKPAPRHTSSSTISPSIRPS